MAIKHGIFVQEPVEGARQLVLVASAVVGLVGTAPDADADLFPVNTPVLVADLVASLAALGEDGSLPKALAAMAEQASPVTVVVRVEEGADAAATLTNVTGTLAAKTGVYALLKAEVMTGVRPRILGVPGFGAQTVTTALVTVAKGLNGFAYAGCDTSDTIAEAVTYAGQFSARELMLIYGDFSDGTAIARALGLRARIDEETGWHKSISNVAVNGVTGVSLPVFFDLQDASSEAGVLNAANVSCIIHRQGYRFWGNRTLSDEPAFAFETATRTAQVLRDTIAEGLFWAVDKPLTPSLARDVIDTINNSFRDLKQQGRIIDAEARLEPGANTAGSLASGALAIEYDFTPVPPLEQLNLKQRITDRYLANFADLVSNAAL